MDELSESTYYLSLLVCLSVSLGEFSLNFWKKKARFCCIKWDGIAVKRTTDNISVIALIIMPVLKHYFFHKSF